MLGGASFDSAQDRLTMNENRKAGCQPALHLHRRCYPVLHCRVCGYGSLAHGQSNTDNIQIFTQLKFPLYNELHSRGKQAVLSSDRPPKAMVTLEERLQSRFESGLMADIQLPEIETRKAILQAKVEDSGVEIPDHVIDLIAHHIRNSVRELEGALNKVIVSFCFQDPYIRTGSIANRPSLLCPWA
ncbi:MAG TPA: DnaA/Hda family protein [Anaerolineae bacterium]